MNSRNFSAKILLFGEYGVLKKSRALSIPYHRFSGRLEIGSLNDDNIKKSNSEIKDLFIYLIKSNMKDHINITQFDHDLNKGLFFDSSIPVGYGVGSSGALVAAVYNKYFLDKIDLSKNINPETFVKLRETFSEIESYFHGQSSGLDPLNSYVGLPLVINSENEIMITKLPSAKPESKCGIFIIDSGKPSDTGDFIKIFKNLFNENGFDDNFNQNFILPTNNCVNSLINYEFNSLSKNFKTISKFTLDRLSPMIPKNFNKIWKVGLESENYFLKLCGSGGGGYIIGFSVNLQKAKEQLSTFNFQEILSY